MIIGNLEAATARTRERVPPVNVNEIFSGVWQGEGPAAGERCAFLRLANCNLNCGKGAGSTWACDTPYTWDWDLHDRHLEVHALTAEDAADQVNAALGYHTRLLVVSGGEPLLQRDALEALLDHLQIGVAVDIETNGTRPPLNIPIRRYVCSPKLANSGVPEGLRIKPDVLRQLEDADLADQPTAFKFVATHPEDLDEVDRIVDGCDLTNVWIMPGGTSADEVLTHARRIAPAVEARGYNLSLRQQILLNGDRRGT